MNVNLRRYAGIYVVTLVVAALAIWALRQIAQIDLASSFVPLIPAMVAAMVEGHKLAKEGADYPKGKPAWVASAKMTGVALAFNGGLGLVVFLALSGAGLQVRSIMVFAGFLAMYCVFWMVANRIFLTQGYRNAMATAKSGKAGRS